MSFSPETFFYIVSHLKHHLQGTFLDWKKSTYPIFWADRNNWDQRSTKLCHKFRNIDFQLNLRPAHHRDINGEIVTLRNLHLGLIPESWTQCCEWIAPVGQINRLAGVLAWRAALASCSSAKAAPPGTQHTAKSWNSHEARCSIFHMAPNSRN